MLQRKKIKKTTAATSVSNVWGLENFLPDRDEGEDDETQKEHEEWLELELKKTCPDKNKIKLLMGLTFPDRRALIVTHGTPVKDLLSKYQCLADSDEVCVNNTSN